MNNRTKDSRTWDLQRLDDMLLARGCLALYEYINQKVLGNKDRDAVQDFLERASTHVIRKITEDIGLTEEQKIAAINRCRETANSMFVKHLSELLKVKQGVTNEAGSVH